ncbi:MAG: hypothetical protein OK436_03125 [Thaumarchaeota archaeon]|nr:hypothetical protein [Nitrososphaerota archaeon]
MSFLLAWMAANDPKAYRAAEVRAGIRSKGGGKAKKRGRGKASKGKKKMSPKLKAFLKKHHRFPKKGEL